MLFTGLVKLGFAVPLRGVDKLSVETEGSDEELAGRVTLVAESKLRWPYFGARTFSCSCCACSCFSTSFTLALLGMKPQIEDALDSFCIDGSGVLPLDTHTPSTSTPLSRALMPNGTSSARGTPGPRRFWLISRCSACSFRSFSATAEYLCNRQCVCASLMLPMHIVRVMPQPSICFRQQLARRLGRRMVTYEYKFLPEFPLFEERFSHHWSWTGALSVAKLAHIWRSDVETELRKERLRTS